MAKFNRRVTAYLIGLRYAGGTREAVAFDGDLVYMSQYKDHAEEEMARLKSDGEDVHLIEVQGPQGMTFKEMQHNMTVSYKQHAHQERA